MCFAVVLFEYSLSVGPLPSPTIIVGGELNDQSEENESQAFKTTFSVLDKSPEVLVLADQLEVLYIDKKIEVAEILGDARVKSFSRESKKVSVLIHIINSLYVRRDYILCLPLFEQLNVTQLEQFGVRFQYAKSLAKLKKYQAAIIQYQTLLKNQGNHQAASINLGLLLTQQGLFAKAKSIFLHAVEITSGTRKAKALSGVADSEVALGNINQAISYYQKSITYRPGYALTWKKLARAYLAKGTVESKVIETYQKSLELAPTNYRLMAEFSDYLFSQVRFELLNPILRKNLKLQKSANRQRVLLTISYLALSRPINASKQVKLFKKYGETNQHKNQIKGLELYLSKQYRQSIISFKKNLKKERDNDIDYYLISIAYLKLNKPKNAAVYFNKIKADSVLYNVAQLKLALSQIELNDTQKAFSRLSYLFKRLPENTPVAYQVAKLAYQQKNIKIALASIVIATGIDKTAVPKEYHLLRARIEWKAGLKHQSINHLSQLLIEMPRYKAGIYRLADYLEQSGDFNSALNRFEELLLVSREYSDVLYRVARIKWQHSNPNSANLPPRKRDEVASLLKEYLQFRSNDVKVRLFYATIFCETYQYKTCKQQINLVLKLSPKNKDALDLKQNFTAKLSLL